MKKVDVVLYHGHCRDGFTAAWVVHKIHPQAQYIPVHYHLPHEPVLDECRGKRVMVVDFSFPRDVMMKFAEEAKEILVLDHHKTAEKEISDLPYCIFDMKRSGAGMVWDHLMKGHPRPWLVDYVEDRDIWNWNLPDSAEVNAFVGNVAMQWYAWDNLSQMDVKQVAEMGKHILVRQEMLVKQMVESSQEYIEIDGRPGLLVNASCLQSEVGDYVYNNGWDFAIIWSITSDGNIRYSLRAKEMDVSAIAKAFGGGGHKLAAGCGRTYDGKGFISHLPFERYREQETCQPRASDMSPT